jgi:DNA-binding XRE family transcriptional regulator
VVDVVCIRILPNAIVLPMYITPRGGGEKMNDTSKLKACRERAGLTQMALAIAAGLQPGLVCRYEKGMRPNQMNARRLAKALNCDVRTVFPDYEKMRNY